MGGRGVPWVEGANSVVFCNDSCCLWIRTGDDVAKDTRFQFASTVVSDGLSGSAASAAHLSVAEVLMRRQHSVQQKTDTNTRHERIKGGGRVGHEATPAALSVFSFDPTIAGSA